MSDLRTKRDKKWADKIREGDEAAFEALFRSYSEELCGFVQYHVDYRAVAEDVVQTIFCDLWDRREEWHPKGTVKAYLYRAARNKSLDWLKHQRVRRRWEKGEKLRSQVAPDDPDDVLRHSELRKTMDQAIEELPERRRLVYRMARQQGMSYAEIAIALDISTKTVENQIGRALKFLRKRLSGFLTITLL